LQINNTGIIKQLREGHCDNPNYKTFSSALASWRLKQQSRLKCTSK